MKTFKLNYLTAVLFGATSICTYGQTSKVWVTFDRNTDVPELIGGKLVSTNEQIQKLIEENNILNVEQAVPSSQLESLQKVYEVECWCDGESLAANMDRVEGLTNPERAPEYELMNDPNDYNIAFAHDYALDLINAKTAWEYSTGDSSIIIGVSDGNFFTNHEELQNNIVYLDAPFSYATMYYYHGTAVATTAAGNTNNSLGKSAIGYNCKLALATMSYNKLLDLSYFGARVVNVSWTSGCWYNSYIQMIIDEIYNNGTIIVAAAGNGSTCGNPNNLVYPAACDHVIAVSSVGPHDNHQRTIGNPYTTHQHNLSVDICAPGYDVPLTVAPGWYLTGNGTSFAAPIVTGTVGLMLSLRPCMGYDDVLSILQSTAVNIDAQNPLYVGLLGAGRLDAGEAMKAVYELSCYEDDGNNGHGNDDGHFDPSNPGNGGGPNGGNGGNGGNGNSGNNGNNVSNGNEPNVIHNSGEHAGNGGSSQSGRITGSESNTNEVKVTMTPNPTNGSVALRWNVEEVSKIVVINALGDVVHEVLLTPETRSLVINLEDRGVFFVKLIQGNEQLWSDKIVRI